ncbi:MAG: hypothetical protein ACRDWD_05965 [Acidimicrobiia bacterium]
MTTIQFVAAAGLALVVFVLLANFVVFVYARGVVRAAVDEGARRGGRLGASTAECEARAQDIVDDLLGGRMGDDVTVSCSTSAGIVVARGRARLHGWLPAVPDWTFTLEGRSVQERAP